MPRDEEREKKKKRQGKVADEAILSNELKSKIVVMDFPQQSVTGGRRNSPACQGWREMLQMLAWQISTLKISLIHLARLR